MKALLSPLPSEPPGSSRGSLLPDSASRSRDGGKGEGTGHTYTMASLGHSLEVLYHIFSLLRGMAPLKYSRQHSRPTLVPRAMEKEGAGVPVSVCVWYQNGSTCVCLGVSCRGVSCECLCVSICAHCVPEVSVLGGPYGLGGLSVHISVCVCEVCVSRGPCVSLRVCARMCLCVHLCA